MARGVDQGLRRPGHGGFKADRHQGCDHGAGKPQRLTKPVAGNEFQDLEVGQGSLAELACVFVKNFAHGFGFLARMGPGASLVRAL